MSTRRISLTLPAPTEATSYPIIIGSGLLERLGELLELKSYSRTLILVDSNIKDVVAPRLAPILSDFVHLHAVACGEKRKDFSHLEELLLVFHQQKLDRQSLIVNIGGGMLGDFAGFAASIYMRGIRFVQAPSTLLAQVDASVGGKVAINFAGVKNLVGAFQQPEMVLIDTGLLHSLPRREFFSGFAEIIKHAVIQDTNLLLKLERSKPADLSDDALADIIEHSCSIKAAVVQKDPQEAGLRRILNFGHTIGHAIEALAAESTSPLLHGECVALGMVAEAAVSVTRGDFSAEAFNRLKGVLTHFQLPVQLAQRFETDRLIERMLSDKKNSSGTILMALPKTMGSCEARVPVSTEEIVKALNVLY